MVVSMLGCEATFEILNVMEYSSARGRMSVVARSADGGLRLLSKGSDAKIMGILAKGVDQALLDATNSNLHLFATQVCSALPGGRQNSWTLAARHALPCAALPAVLRTRLPLPWKFCALRFALLWAQYPSSTSQCWTLIHRTQSVPETCWKCTGHCGACFHA